MVMTAEATKTKGSKVDWRTVRGLMVDAIYGGRVDNPHDMRVLATYLRRYFNSDVVSACTLVSVPRCAGNATKISMLQCQYIRVFCVLNLCPALNLFL